MEDINGELFEAIGEKDQKKVLMVFNKYRDNPKLYSCLSIDEALNVSIPTQHVEIIKLLLNYHANVGYTDAYGKRAIHLAAETGNVEIIKLILRYGSPVNVANNEGKTPLHLAIECGFESVVELLLDAGANINRAQTYQMNEYPIHVAVKTGHIRIIHALKAKGANLEALAAHQRTPLHYAVLFKQYCTLDCMCDLNVNLDAMDSHGDTALSLALGRGLLHMADVLLEKGARADVRTQSNRTVLHFIPSLMNKHIEPGNRSDLYHKLLTSASHCVNLCSENGTPLHTAVNLNCLRAAELFIDWGADVNVMDSNEYAPLKLAVGSNNVELVALLLSQGANLRVHERSTGNVLHTLLMAQGLSARRSKVDVLKLLVTAGCEINLVDRRGFTPLDRQLFSTAPNTGRAEVVELVHAGAVLEQGISNMCNLHALIVGMGQQGWRMKRTSALLLCTWYGDLHTANYLVESSCVTGHVLRHQQWLALPGKDEESESYLTHWREFSKSPESLTRICRIELRRYLRHVTGDKDIRDRLQNLPLPTMLHNFVSLKNETEVYLKSEKLNLSRRLYQLR